MLKKSGLGKGLSSLIPVTKDQETMTEGFQEIRVELIDPNPEQPRHVFDETLLNELSESIRNHGVIQPILVTRSGERFTVIAGERRWRATKLAGYEQIPAIVREVEPGKMLALALLENIQRQELNPVEEAEAYRKLLDANQFTHEDLAKHLGKGRVTVSNTLRLLKLPEAVQDMIQDGRLSFGHARCLLGLEDSVAMEKMARLSIEKLWSVRELEERVKQEREPKVKRERTKKADAGLKGWAENLSKTLNTKVSIQGNGQKGRVVISYGSEPEFQNLCETLARLAEVGREAHG